MTAGKNRGASMLFVLAALIVVGFLGTAMVKMSGSDTINTINYHASASARSAAKSGIISAIHYFESGDDAVRERLQAWVDAPTSAAVSEDDRWVRGSATAYNSLSGEPMARGVAGYKVEMLAFDTATFNITLKSHGVGKAGSRATMVSVYNLEGLRLGFKRDWTDQHAFYIEDDVDLTFNAPILINGKTRLSSGSEFDAWATGSEFNGDFRTQESNYRMDFMGEFSFTENAYFGTQPYWKRIDGIYYKPGSTSETVTRIIPGVGDIAGKSGFPKGAYYDGGFPNEKTQRIETVINDDSYWLKEPEVKDKSKTTFITQKKGTIFHDDLDLTDELEVKEHYNPLDFEDLSADIILKELNMPYSSCLIKVNPEVIPNDVITTVDGINIEDINTGTFPLWNGFVVLRIAPGPNRNIGNSGVLKRKVILLVDGVVQPTFTGQTFSAEVKLDASGDVISKESASFHVIVRAGGEARNWGGWSTMRGLLYRQTGGKMDIGGSLNSGVNNLYGSVYAESGSAIKWHPLARQRGQITFDPTVYEELDVVGQLVDGNNRLITIEGCSEEPDTLGSSDLEQMSPHLQANLVSQIL